MIVLILQFFGLIILPLLGIIIVVCLVGVILYIPIMIIGGTLEWLYKLLRKW